VNIAFVTSSKIWSGVKTWMLEFGQALHRRGHSVHVMAADDKFLAECWDGGLTAHPARFGPDYNPAAIFRFARLLREAGVEIACMNLNKDLRTAGIAARLLRIPVVHRVGLPGDLSAKWDARLAQRWLVDDILVTSHWLRASLLARHPFLRFDRLHVVYNGKHGVRPPAPRLRHRRVRFVTASRLAPDKNHLDLLEACARLRAAGAPEFTLDIFGEGPMELELRAAIARWGLSNTVRLNGFTVRLAAVLPAYDFGVLPSRREALSNALLEFQAAGLPVIATRVGATPEVIRSGENGLLYEAGDSAALAAHMQACLAMDAATYRAMAEAAQLTIQQRFQIERLAVQLEAYFLHVAGGVREKREIRRAHAA
jgi:glycosyltransferase involved in cell wall biosynthesis